MIRESLVSGLSALTFARHATCQFLEDFQGEQWFLQVVPNANHPLWVMGHLAWTDDHFLTNVAGRPSAVDAKWTELFGMGSKPTPAASNYPSVDEVRSAFHSRREELISWFDSLSEDVLASPLPEDFTGFAPNHGALPGTLAFHEGMHAGQITVVRKALGLAPKFG